VVKKATLTKLSYSSISGLDSSIKQEGYIHADVPLLLRKCLLAGN
jgi:hypothetical protein